jgi:demethylmenaquinone methyltransferase/2-methoxy-6-polyprenyl-1,4-benzoquinol methylase
MDKQYNKNSPETIANLFDSIASSYDTTNTILSFGLHKIWNKALIKALGTPETLLDLCAGTGEISFLMMQQNKALKKTLLLDFSKEMLLMAKQKSLKQENKKVDIKFIQGDATKIPLDSNHVEAISIAYGLRNIKEPHLCIKEAFRTLKPGSPFGILELTEPKFKILKRLHTLYLQYFLPLAGKLLTTNKEAYKYLSNSIPQFLSPQKVKEMLQDAGFENIRILRQTGGIATLIVANKPQ